MSLICSLIYNNKQRISSGHDLSNIMNIGNQLYSIKFVSICTTVVFNAGGIANKVKCVWGWLSARLFWHCASRNNNRRISVLYLFTKSLWITHMWRLHHIYYCYTYFILTVRFTGVATYCTGNMGFKIFDSHARKL